MRTETRRYSIVEGGYRQFFGRGKDGLELHSHTNTVLVS
jgi:hypothetical protein